MKNIGNATFFYSIKQLSLKNASLVWGWKRLVIHIAGQWRLSRAALGFLRFTKSIFNIKQSHGKVAHDLLLKGSLIKKTYSSIIFFPQIWESYVCLAQKNIKYTHNRYTYRTLKNKLIKRFEGLVEIRPTSSLSRQCLCLLLVHFRASVQYPFMHQQVQQECSNTRARDVPACVASELRTYSGFLWVVLAPQHSNHDWSCSGEPDWSASIVVWSVRAGDRVCVHSCVCVYGGVAPILHNLRVTFGPTFCTPVGGGGGSCCQRYMDNGPGARTGTFAHIRWIGVYHKKTAKK